MSVIQKIRDKGAWIMFGLIAIALISFILQDRALGGGRGGIFTNTYKNGVLTYSVCLNGLAAKNLELFIEAYGFNANHSSPETGLDGGAIWYPNDWSQIDISLAVNRYQHANFSTILIGYSFAVDRKK